MTGVERLQHVERLTPTNLADHKAVGTHPQRSADEVAHTHRARAFGIRWPRFEPDDVRLCEAQLGCLLDGDDAFRSRNCAGECVQQRGLAGARTAGNKKVPTRVDGPAKER